MCFLGRAITAIIIFVVGVVSFGCSASFPFNKTNVQMGGARVLLPEGPFESVDLAIEVAPKIKKREGSETIDDDRDRLRKALNDFYDDPIEQDLRRNRVQERLLAASVQRCGEYKQFLKQLEGETNWLIGSLTTAAGAAGAIVTGVDAARILAGVAAVFSGVRAEFNESFFQRLTIQVITEGLEARRREIYSQIQPRQRTDIASYPLEAAVKDALDYHSACSLIAGLEHAALSIERAENPGLRGAERALVQSKRLQAIAADKLDDPILSFNNQPLPSIVGPETITLPSKNPRDAYVSRVAQIAQRTVAFMLKMQSLTGEKGELAAKKDEVTLLEEVLRRDRDYVLVELEGQFRNRVLAQDTKIRAIETDMLSGKEPRKRGAKYTELMRATKEGESIVADLDVPCLTFQLTVLDAEGSLDQRPVSDEATKGARKYLLQLAFYLLDLRAERTLRAVNALDKNDPKLAAVKKALELAANASADDIRKGLDAKAIASWSDITWTKGSTFPGDGLVGRLDAVDKALK